MLSHAEQPLRHGRSLTVQQCLSVQSEFAEEADRALDFFLPRAQVVNG